MPIYCRLDPRQVYAGPIISSVIVVNHFASGEDLNNLEGWALVVLKYFALSSSD